MCNVLYLIQISPQSQCRCCAVSSDVGAGCGSLLNSRKRLGLLRTDVASLNDNAIPHIANRKR